MNFEKIIKFWAKTHHFPIMASEIDFLLKQLKNAIEEDFAGEIITAYEESLSEYADELSNNQNFYNLPFENLLRIVKQIDFSKFADRVMIIERIISQTTAKYSDQALRLIPAFSFSNAKPTPLEALEMVSYFSRCDIIDSLQELNQSVEIDYDYEIEKRDQEIESDHIIIESLRSLLLEEHSGNSTKKYFPSHLEDDIFDAVSNGALSHVQFYVERLRVDPSEKDRFGFDVLERATQYGYYDITKYLIDFCGMVPTKKLMMIAINNSHFKILKFLIDKYLIFNLRSDPVAIENFRNTFGGQLLISACYNGSFRTVQYLTDILRVNVNFQDPKSGRTALHCAVIKYNHEKYRIIKQLVLKHKANPSIIDNHGNSVYDIAGESTTSFINSLLV